MNTATTKPMHDVMHGGCVKLGAGAARPQRPASRLRHAPRCQAIECHSAAHT